MNFELNNLTLEETMTVQHLAQTLQDGIER